MSVITLVSYFCVQRPRFVEHIRGSSAESPAKVLPGEMRVELFSAKLFIFTPKPMLA
jgi:hypothetical protein